MHYDITAPSNMCQALDSTHKHMGRLWRCCKHWFHFTIP